MKFASHFLLVPFLLKAYGFTAPRTTHSKDVMHRPESHLQKHSQVRSHLEMTIELRPTDRNKNVIIISEEPTNFLKNALSGQAILLATSALVGALLSLNPLGEELKLPLEWEDWKLVYSFVVPTIAVGFVVDRLPGKVFQDMFMDTKLFVLRILGFSTNIVSAITLSALLSTGAAISEEVFFRGLLFTIIAPIFGLWPALIISSLSFGFAHFPKLGAPQQVIETILGGIFGYAFILSGYNLAVPIAIHATYDFITIMVTWGLANQDFKVQMSDALTEHLNRQQERKAKTADVLRDEDVGGF